MLVSVSVTAAMFAAIWITLHTDGNAKGWAAATFYYFSRESMILLKDLHGFGLVFRHFS